MSEEKIPKNQKSCKSPRERQSRAPNDFAASLPIYRACNLGLTRKGLAGAIPYLQFPGGREIYLDREEFEKFIRENKKVLDE